MYDAVYSQNIGLCGFRCRVGACTRVVRTQRGILMHCRRVHGMVAQRELFEGDMTLAKEKKNGKSKAKTVRKLEPVRDSSGNEALAGLFDAVRAREATKD